MSSFEQWFTDVHLEYGHLIKPLLVGTLISIVCSLIGCFIVLRKMSFLSDAIAHSMLAGVVGGYLIMKMLFGREADLAGMLLGAVIAGIVTVALIGFVTRLSRIKEDTAIGIMYTGIFALGAFVVSTKYFGSRVHIDLYHFVLGSVLSVGPAEFWLLGIAAAIVFSVIILFYRQLQITSFDPVMAASIGIPVVLFDYILTACTSLVVVAGVRIAGVILVVALMITPAASAYLLFDRLNRMLIASAVIGVVGCWLGFALAIVFGASPGPSIVISSTAIFLFTLTFAPRHGLLADWMRRRRIVPTEIKEDVIGSILKSRDESVPVTSLLKNVEFPNRQIRRAISSLIRQDLIDVRAGQVSLTSEGVREGRRLQRAHRLWETYLNRTGTPESQLHEKAHLLEHLNDEETVDYLDDKLGHPLVDPHGAEIPEDFYHIEQEQMMLSLLREGHVAEIVEVRWPADSLDVLPGDRFTIGHRDANETTWTIQTGDGRTIRLDHDQADNVMVRLIRKNDDGESTD